MTDLSEPTVRPASTGSVIWILPAIALLICIWLAWEAHNKRGIEVEVVFNTGDGIEAGKTGVVYKGITVGLVRSLRLLTDEQGKQVVVATMDIKKEFEENLLKTTKFWLVKPSVTLAGVTGLDTLVSGNYIGVSVGSGEPTRYFSALDEEPPISDSQIGLNLTLTAENLGSLNKGSPVTYRKIQVGHVTGYHLSPEENSIRINIFIKAEYAALVRKTSIFWNASGVSVDAGLNGLKVHTESFASILAGGIAFSTPDYEKSGEPVDSSIQFKLYDDYDDAQVGIQVKVTFSDYDGLQPKKTPVIYNGVQLGILKDLNISRDLKEAEATLSMDPLIDTYLVEGTDFWLVKPSISLAGITGLEALVKGNYIAIRLGKKESAKKKSFMALAKIPSLNEMAPGLHLLLVSESLGSLDVGSPVLYKQVKVGSVQSYQFSRDRQSVIIGIHIESAHAELVNNSSRFWNASGISVSGGLSGVKVHSESLQALMVGGIAFDTPDAQSALSKQVPRFKLYKDFESVIKNGVQIEIHLNRGDGLVPGTTIRYRGLEVGRVDEVTLSSNLQGVDLKARITQAEDRIVRIGTRFRVVRPELGLLKTANLDTLVSGPYLEVYPGRADAARQTRFIAIEQQNQTLEAQGLILTLTTPRLGSIRPGNSVTYREVVVGKVIDYELGPNADRVLIKLLIEPRFAPLVHTGSRFWESSGIAADFSLLEGARFRTESLQTLMEGGIAFATPDGELMGRQALPGQTFMLVKTPKEEWLNWAPKIPLEPR